MNSKKMLAYYFYGEEEANIPSEVTNAIAEITGTEVTTNSSQNSSVDVAMSDLVRSEAACPNISVRDSEEELSRSTECSESECTNNNDDNETILAGAPMKKRRTDESDESVGAVRDFSEIRADPKSGGLRTNSDGGVSSPRSESMQRAIESLSESVAKMRAEIDRTEEIRRDSSLQLAKGLMLLMDQYTSALKRSGNCENSDTEGRSSSLSKLRMTESESGDETAKDGRTSSPKTHEAPEIDSQKIIGEGKGTIC